MKLTPLDIHHKEFRNALRGYNSEEVDDFLDEVADEFERLFKENIDLSEKLDAAAERIRSYGELEHTLQNTLVSAQTSAEDIVARARTESERLLRSSEQKAQEIVSSALEEKQHSQAEYARLQAAEDAFRSRFRRMLENYLVELAPSAAGSETAVPAPASAAPKAADPVPAPVEEPQLSIEPPVEPAAAQPVAPRRAAKPARAAAPDDASGSTVVSLTLGEVGDAVEFEDDVPSLDVPAEFTFPKHGTIGELDDLDIEEID
jgi:cell division initiation protein